MPTSVTAVLVALIAVFPGLIGNWVYQNLVGVDWREKEWRSILRMLGFSIIGAVLYSVLAGAFGWPPAVHLFPSAYPKLAPTSDQINAIFIPYAGHLVGGFVAGILAAWGAKVIARLSAASAFPGAWDDFIRTCTAHHWVVVALSNNEVYAGKLRSADLGVASTERELILEEPCLFEESSGYYRALGHQYLFIPAGALHSIAAVYEPQLDERTVGVGNTLFEKGEVDEHQEGPGPSTTAPD